MKQSCFFILIFLSLQPSVHGQRVARRSHPSTTIYQPKSFNGRFFKVTLTNTDTVPVLLKLGRMGQIENGDTLNLARTYPCSSPAAGEYYDLHDLVAQEDNCVRWYTLQYIKPKDTVRFVVKLKDFDKSDTSRFYYCYTKEVIKVDRELNLYADPKKIYLMKDNRKFTSDYIVLDNEALKTGPTKVGLNIYLSASNQQ